MVECCEDVSLVELCDRLDAKPNTLGKHLHDLMDRDLVERTERGRYRAADWERVLNRERTLGGEKLAENLDRDRYERQREAYRMYLEKKRQRRGASRSRSRLGPRRKEEEEEEEEEIGPLAEVLKMARACLGVIPPARFARPPWHVEGVALR